jgi:hypothetical protein
MARAQEKETRRMWVNSLILAVCVLAGAVAVTVLGVLHLGREQAPNAAPPDDASWQAPAVWGAADQWHGLAIDLHNPDTPEGYFRKYVDEVADLGCDAVCFKLSGFQENKYSVRVYMDVRKIMPLDRLGRLVAHAHDRGLKVMLLPIVVPDAPLDNEWRGEYAPGEGKKWSQWFVSYTAFIHYWAKFALANRVEMLSVGSELISSEVHTLQWRNLISSTRGIVKDNVLLTYSANWDHYEKIGFWDLLDVVGMTSYHRLAEKDQGTPSVGQLKERWLPIKRRIEAFSQRVDRPIFFTEVGWCSLSGATYEPWDYYRIAGVNLQEQANAYQAYMETWQDSPFVGGMIFWEWSTNDGGPQDRGYTPKNKPAGDLLAQWLAARRAATASRPASRPATSPQTPEP